MSENVVTNAGGSPAIDTLVAEVVRVMERARRRWSRDDYGTETQDEFVAAEVIAFLRPAPSEASS